jgi:L,D-transpeptidase ErfK/SrfK
MLVLAHSTAGAAEFTIAGDEAVIGSLQIYMTKQDDTLLDVQRAYDVGYAELIAANQDVDAWLPGEGTRVVIPTRFILPPLPHVGIVINLGERRLYYFHPDHKTVETFPIGVAVEGKETPAGVTTIVAKEKNPAWYPPPSIRAEDPTLPAVVPPGPDNPLGDYALRLGWADFLIHGTNKPDGVGRNVSHGCIRLYPEDILRLYAEVPIGTPVRVVDQSILAAWSHGRLYVAVHPTKSQTDEIGEGKLMTAIPQLEAALTAAVANVAGDRRGVVKWDLVNRLGRETSGIPVAVTVSDEMAGGP